MNKTSTNVPPKLRSTIGMTPQHGVRQTVSWQRVSVVCVCTMYFLVLNWSYLEVDSVLYGGLGFLYASSPWKVFLTAFFMAVIPSLWLPFELRYPSQVCYWLVYLCVVVPTMFLPYHVLTYESIG